MFTLLLAALVCLFISLTFMHSDFGLFFRWRGLGSFGFNFPSFFPNIIWALEIDETFLCVFQQCPTVFYLCVWCLRLSLHADTVFVIFMFSVVPFLCQVFDDHCTKFLLSFLFFLVLHIFCLLHAVAHYHICLCTRVLRVGVCGVLEIKYLLPSSAVDIIPVVAIALL